MDSPVLMNKLMEIERALDHLDNAVIRNLILEAQTGVRRLESENEHLVQENSRLHRRLDHERHSPRRHFVPRSCSCAQLLPEEAPAPATFADDSPDHPRLLAWRTTHFFFSSK